MLGQDLIQKSDDATTAKTKEADSTSHIGKISE